MARPVGSEWRCAVCGRRASELIAERKAHQLKVNMSTCSGRCRREFEARLAAEVERFMAEQKRHR
jgi:bacterioferritin-associated ferredoxin